MLLVRTYNKLPQAAKVLFWAVVVVLAFFIARYIKNKIKYSWNKRPVNYNNIPVVGNGGSSSGSSSSGSSNSSSSGPVYWNPDPLAREIFEALDGWNLRVYPEVVQKILDLQTDDQVILLYNHYNDHYATESYPTLTKQIEGEWPDSKGVYKAAIARLKSLQLY